MIIIYGLICLVVILGAVLGVYNPYPDTDICNKCHLNTGKIIGYVSPTSPLYECNKCLKKIR